LPGTLMALCENVSEDKSLAPQDPLLDPIAYRMI